MLLGLLERRRAAPVTAAIDHAPIEHRTVKIATEIVVLLTDLKRSGLPLQIPEPRLQGKQQIRQRANVAMEISPKRFADHLVELLAIPPAVHVAFADTEHALRDDSGVGVVVMDRHIPGSIAANADIPRPEHALNPAPIPLRCHLKTQLEVVVI